MRQLVHVQRQLGHLGNYSPLHVSKKQSGLLYVAHPDPQMDIYIAQKSLKIIRYNELKLPQEEGWDSSILRDI